MVVPASKKKLFEVLLRLGINSAMKPLWMMQLLRSANLKPKS